MSSTVGGDETDTDPVPGPIADVTGTPKRRAAYCALVDTLSAEGGKKNHVSLRTLGSTSLVSDIYDAMDDHGLVAKEGERRAATYTVSDEAVRIRDRLATDHPGWTAGLEPFWEAAYETGLARDLMDTVTSPEKEQAFTVLVAGIDTTDASLSAIAEGTELSYGGINRFRKELEAARLVASDGERAATTYRLDDGADAARAVAAAHAAEMEPFDITDLPYAETDTGMIPEAAADAAVADIFGPDPDSGTAETDAAEDGPGYLDAARAALHAERTGQDIAAVADRYGLDGNDAAALVDIERGVLERMLTDAAGAGSALSDAVLAYAVDTDDDRPGDLDDALDAAWEASAALDPVPETGEPDAPGPDPVEETAVPEGWEPDAAVLRDLAEAPELGTAGKRHVVAYLAAHGPADRDDIYDAMDLDNRELAQGVRFLSDDGLVTVDGNTVELTGTGEQLYDDPTRGVFTLSPEDEADVAALADFVAVLRRGGTLRDVSRTRDESYGTTKGKYGTFERQGFLEGHGKNWRNRTYSVDDTALSEAGLLEAVEERAAPALLGAGADRAGRLAWFANTYDRANSRFREYWDADELPEDMIIPQWQEFLAAARASAVQDGTLEAASVWTDCTSYALEDRLDRLPDEAVTVHVPDDDEDVKKERRVRVHPRFHDVLDAFADRLTFDPADVAYQGAQEVVSEEDLPWWEREDAEPDGAAGDGDVVEDGGEDGPRWTDFSTM